MEIGSLADWASAGGSILAAIVALYLAGSAARAAKTSQRPQVFCQVKRGQRLQGFLELRLRVENHSIKEWWVKSLALEKPTAKALVDERACMATSSLGEKEFDATLASKNLVSQTLLDTLLKPAGSKGGGAGIPFHRTDIMSRTFFLDEHSAGSGFTIKIELVSLEPIPDRFSVRVPRRPPWI